MKSISTETQEKVNELLRCLDKDSEHIEDSLSQLNKLRGFVIKRDDSGLSKLLKVIQAESHSYRSNESNRQKICEELAGILGYSAEQLTLSVLETSLTGRQKTQIGNKRKKLASLIEQLKKEYLSTALLLSECARFNTLLLRSIFELGNTGGLYYNANGATKQQNETAFMNLQL
jgi:hypothetical protein